MKKKTRKRKNKKDSLKINDDWQNAVKKAIEKGKPPEGWPKPKK